MTTCWPKISDKRAPRIRARTSDPLPAGNVTTIVTGRVGQSSATAGMIAAASVAPRRTALMLDMATLQSHSFKVHICFFTDTIASRNVADRPSRHI
jgi:hypothetical protein